jgi:hypothetical protein
MTFSTAFQADAFQNDAFQVAVTPDVTQRFTGAGGWNKDWAKTYGVERYWTVKAKGKKRKKFKTAEAAIQAAATSTVEAVEFAGVDLLAEFRALVVRFRDEGAMRANMAAKLAELEMHARREAAERDDEEALLLLLH